MQTTNSDAVEALVAAALAHVPFDGWSEPTFEAAIKDASIDPALARTLCPRGAIDLALAFHRKGDEKMVAAIKELDMSELRFRDRIAKAVRLRLEAVPDKEAVRRGSTLFALPQNSALGAQAIWGTADAIWTALGDTSDDYNWYSKRATLSAVYGSTVLFWLGDTSANHVQTWEFLDRRIDNVMQIEKLKAQANANPLLKSLSAGPNWVLSQIKPPAKMPRMDIPGVFSGTQDRT